MLECNDMGCYPWNLLSQHPVAPMGSMAVVTPSFPRLGICVQTHDTRRPGALAASAGRRPVSELVQLGLSNIRALSIIIISGLGPILQII